MLRPAAFSLRLRSIALVLLVATTLFAASAPRALAAPTRALVASSSIPLLLVHGWADTCAGGFATPISSSQQTIALTYLDTHSRSRTNGIDQVGYYNTTRTTTNPKGFSELGCDHIIQTDDATLKASTGCNASAILPDSSVEGTLNDPILHLSCLLAWYIYENYTVTGQTVDILAHSMGGLIVRAAIGKSGGVGSDSHFPPPLAVNNVVTVQTPHAGLIGDNFNSAVAIDSQFGHQPVSQEVKDMESTSPFMQMLSTLQAPQGATGTHWGLIASSVPCVSGSNIILDANYSLSCDQQQADIDSPSNGDIYPWGDGVVQATSALGMQADTKVLYGQVFNDRTGQLSTADPNTTYSHEVNSCLELPSLNPCTPSEASSCELSGPTLTIRCLRAPFYLNDGRDTALTQAWVCSGGCTANTTFADMNITGPTRVVPTALPEIDRLLAVGEDPDVYDVPSGGAFAQVWIAHFDIGTPTGNWFFASGGSAPGGWQEQDFLQGRIYWSPTTSTHEVQGSILSKYISSGVGGPAGGIGLGFPTTDEIETPNVAGRVSYFNGQKCSGGGPNNSGSAIFYTQPTGAHEVHGCIYQAYERLGGPASALGFPTTDEFGVSSGRASNFQHGSITWNGGMASINLNLPPTFTNAATDGFGSMEIFARGSDGNIWHNTKPCATCNWSGWSPLQTNQRFNGDPVVGQNANGRLQVFAQASNNAIWTNWQDAGTGRWVGWSLLSQSFAFAFEETPTVARNSNGVLEIFARGSDGNIWHNFQTCVGCGWSGWSPLQANQRFNGDPVVGQNANGRLQVFAQASNNAIWTNWQDAGTGHWVGWSLLSQSFAFAGTPTVTRNHNAELEIFARGSDGNIWHNFQTCVGCGWSGWSPLQANQVFNSDPVVGRDTDGRLEVFARNLQDAVVINFQNTQGAWQGWSTLSQNFAFLLTPTVVSNTDGRLEVFAEGSNFNIWHNAQSCAGCGWTGWSPLQLGFQFGQ